MPAEPASTVAAGAGLLALLPLLSLVVLIPALARGSVWQIFVRELRAYFTTPTFHLVAAVFLVLAAGFFESHLASFDAALTRAQRPDQAGVIDSLNLVQGVLIPLMHNLALLCLFVIPALTMRLVAEEKRQHTYELLMTAPLSVGRILWGKYLAVMAVVVALLAPTAVFPVILHVYGGIDLAPVLLGYFGLLLLAGAVAAIGLLTSALTESQVVAAVIGWGLALLFYLAGERAAGLEEGTARRVLEYLSLVGHLGGFTEGRLSLADVGYYLSAIFIPLFVAARALQAQRWR